MYTYFEKLQLRKNLKCTKTITPYQVLSINTRKVEDVNCAYIKKLQGRLT